MTQEAEYDDEGEQEERPEEEEYNPTPNNALTDLYARRQSSYNSQSKGSDNADIILDLNMEGSDLIHTDGDFPMPNSKAESKARRQGEILLLRSTDQDPNCFEDKHSQFRKYSDQEVQLEAKGLRSPQRDELDTPKIL